MFPSASSSLSLAKVLTGISKSLNIAKEVIPIYEQVKPFAAKLKSSSKNLNLASILKNNSQNTVIKKENQVPKSVKNYKINNPTFFI